MTTYRDRLPSSLREAFAQARDNQDMLDLRNEIALVRALLDRYLQQSTDTIDEKFLDAVGKTTDRIAKTVKLCDDMLERKRMYVHINMLGAFVASIAAAIRQRIQDPRLVNDLIIELGRVSLDIGAAEPKLVEAHPADATTTTTQLEQPKQANP
uniref:Uncharacterized protein n=1 Tax=viral metagenome TaxID=1070528 RepID=A0A6H1ZGR6_9ZZZZ